jgi:hypothetical protein
MIIAVTVLFVALASALSELDRISFQFDGFRLLNDLVPRAVIAALRARTVDALQRNGTRISDPMAFNGFCPESQQSELLSRVSNSRSATRPTIAQRHCRVSGRLERLLSLSDCRKIPMEFVEF